MRKHHRRSIRLLGYDYSQEGLYFVTMCTYQRQCLFGRIVNHVMHLSDGGKIAQTCWGEIPTHYPWVSLDALMIMPNHIHGNIRIIGANDYSPLQNSGTSRTLGAIIRGYKIGVSKWFNENTDIKPVWQRNYYEHIIRNEKEHHQIMQYMQDNPKNWENDEFRQ